MIIPLTHSWADQASSLYTGCALSGETLFSPLSKEEFSRLFLSCKAADGLALADVEKGRLNGFIVGSIAGSRGFLHVLIVAKEKRRQGIARALLDSLCFALKEKGAQTLEISGDGPIKTNWLIPGTDGHDHNNMPGLDEQSLLAALLPRFGFQVVNAQVGMYLNLASYRPMEELKERILKLQEEGITVGRYDPSLGYDFDRMCDRVHSELWRTVLKNETAAAHPRPILAATVPGYLVGFTGPVDVQSSGRGWFTGICTDPCFEKRGIATALFHLLMQAFIEAGASFSTLYTGDTNHARRIYERAGFSVVKRFLVMRKTL